MAKRIRGITIELGADTTSLEGALSDVNKKSVQLQDELKDVEKLLKFNPRNTELLAQKQEILTKNIAATSDKLNQLKEAEAQVQAQFQRGDIAEEQYRAFQREIADTEASLDRLQGSLQNMQREEQKVAEGTRRLSTLFEATETSVEDYADVLGDRLVRSIKNGTATSRDLEQAFQRVGRQAIGSEGDIDQLRVAIASVDNGNSLETVRRDLQRISQEAEEAEQSFKDLDIGIENVAGALAATGGISSAVEKSLDLSSLNTKINISMEVPEESKKAIKNSVLEVTAVIGDQEAALEGVRRQWALNKDASDESNAAVIEMAGTITNAFSGIDFTELIQEGNEIAATLGISNEEAMGLVNSLLKTGFPPEQLDIIAEYGDQMIQAGFSAEEVQKIMAAGVDTKSWNIDNLLDGVKEGRIQMADFGSGLDDALKDILSQTEISEKQFEDWGKAIAKGGEDGQNAMLEATKALAGVKDETDRNQLGTKMFGTMWEDQGTKIIDTILKAEEKTVDLKKGIDDVSNSTAQINSDPAVEMRKAFSDMLVALTPLLTIIADFIAKIAEWVSNNPVLAASILAVVTGLGILLGIFMALSPIISTITALAPILATAIGAISWPVVAVVAGIAALIAIGILLWKNWDVIKEKAIEIWGAIGETFTTFKNFASEKLSSLWSWMQSFFAEWGPTILAVIAPFIGIPLLIYQNFDQIKSWLSGIWGSVKSDTSTAWKGIKDAIMDPIRTAIDFVKEQIEKLKGLFGGLKLSLPNIKTPHFSIKNWSINPVDWIKAKPRIDVDWYDKGGIFTGPQVIGVGEKRPEFVGALDDLYAIVKNAMQDVVQINNSTSTPQQNFTQQQPNIINNINNQGLLNGAVFHIREEADIRKLAKQLNDYTVQKARQGGVIIAN